MVGTHVDITERKQGEEKLRETTQRLELATASGQLGIWDWNVKENTMVWDERMMELYGVTPDSFINNVDVWVNALHPEDKNRALEECNVALGGKGDYNTTFRILHPDGKIVYIKADGLVIRNKDGDPLRMIGINRNITQSKLAEEELLKAKTRAEESENKLMAKNVEYECINEELIQTNAELLAAKESAEENETRLRSYFQLGLLGMAITSPEKGWVELNDTICNFLGYTKEELIQKTWLELTHPDDIELDISNFNKVLNGETDGYKIDKRFISKTGDVIYTEVAVRCTRDNNKKVKYFLALMNDITERKTSRKKNC
ncbi:MAG: PAS domain-containing protein [Bacteroidales bacterium]|nr:PAS domain-containing protein [Bacteroidales bacterium]